MLRFNVLIAMVLVFAGAVFCPGPLRAQDASPGFSGDVFAGYSMRSGNTDASSASIDAICRRNFMNSVLSAKAKVYYSESNKKMDGQKWSGLAKYDHDFGADRRWFANLQTGVDHDRFLDIDYRLMPAAGLGRHLIRRDEGSWDADISFGREYTHYRSGVGSDDTAVLIGHTFGRFRVFERSCFSEDFTAISRFENGVRIVSEAVFTNPLRDSLDLEVKYIVEYDSEPAAGKTTTDKRFVAGIKYKF